MTEQDPELKPQHVATTPRFRVRGKVQELVSIMKRAASVAPSVEAIPGTSYVLLTARGDSVTASATDGARGVSASAPVKTLIPGAALVPPKKMLAVMAQAPADDYQLVVLGNQVIFISGGSKWVLQTIPGDSLPPAPRVPEDRTEDFVYSSEFLYALRSVMPAASRSSARAALMQVQVSKGFLTALDGGRTHRARVDGMSTDLDFSIPLETAKELEKLLTRTDDEQLFIRVGGKKMEFEVHGEVLSSASLLMGFPPVESLLLPPSMSNNHTLTVSVDDLKAAVKRVTVVADPDRQSMTLTYDSGTLTVEAQDRDGNASREAVKASWKGPDGVRAWRFNYKHLQDFLGLCAGEVTWRVGDDTTQVLTSFYLDTEDTVGLLQQVRESVM